MLVFTDNRQTGLRGELGIKQKAEDPPKTFSKETVKATTGCPAGSRVSEVGGWWERGAASLFVCPLAQQLGVCQRLYHFIPVLHCPACVQSSGEGKGLSSSPGSMASSHSSPVALLRRGTMSNRGSQPKEHGPPRGRYKEKNKKGKVSSSLINAFNQQSRVVPHNKICWSVFILRTVIKSVHLLLFSQICASTHISGGLLCRMTGMHWTTVTLTFTSQLYTLLNEV